MKNLPKFEDYKKLPYKEALSLYEENEACYNDNEKDSILNFLLCQYYDMMESKSLTYHSRSEQDLVLWSNRIEYLDKNLEKEYNYDYHSFMEMYEMLKEDQNYMSYTAWKFAVNKLKEKYNENKHLLKESSQRQLEKIFMEV